MATDELPTSVVVDSPNEVTVRQSHQPDLDLKSSNHSKGTDCENDYDAFDSKMTMWLAAVHQATGWNRRRVKPRPFQRVASDDSDGVGHWVSRRGSMTMGQFYHSSSGGSSGV